MKKLIVLLLSAVLLLIFAGCGANPSESTGYVPSNDPLTNLKNILVSSDKLFAIGFLGKVEGSAASVQEELSQKAFIGQVPYVADIQQYVENEGNELFCIIPTDETVTVTVYKLTENENHFPVLGEVLISSNEPVLVKGNVDPYVANLHVVAQKGTRMAEYTVVRSGIEARLENLDNAMFDITPYNLLPEFHNIATPEKPLCASWLGDIRDANDVEFALLLYIHESGEVRFAFGNSETEMQELYVGTWEIEGDLLKLRMKGGKGTFGAEVLEKNCDFRWDLDAGVMMLQYVGGDPLMPGTEDVTLEFWSND